MLISYASWSPVIPLKVTGTMAARRLENLNMMESKAKAAAIRQPQHRFTGLRFAASDDEIGGSMSSNQESLLAAYQRQTWSGAKGTGTSDRQS